VKAIRYAHAGRENYCFPEGPSLNEVALWAKELPGTVVEVNWNLGLAPGTADCSRHGETVRVYDDWGHTWVEWPEGAPVTGLLAELLQLFDQKLAELG
jgi:hypothetical protein